MRTIVKIVLISLIIAVFSQCRKETEPYVSVTVTIPDINFLDALINTGVDKNGNGLISKGEEAEVTYLDIRGHSIGTLEGIEAFINLDTLKCDENHLISLDLSNNISLTTLTCSINRLKSLNISKNLLLKWMECTDNRLTSLDVSNHPELIWLQCSWNSLASLDASNDPLLASLYCSSNLLTSLDVTTVPELNSLYCDGNLLTSLDLSNNTNISTLSLSSMPSLNKVCVWTIPFPPDGVSADTTGSPYVYFTMNCN